MSLVQKIYVGIFGSFAIIGMLWVSVGAPQSDFDKVMKFLEGETEIRMVMMGERTCFIVPGEVEEIFCECKEKP